MGSAKTATIFSDPLQVTRDFPGLQAALHQWIDEHKPRPWDRSALNDFLASYAYEVRVGPVVWGAYYESAQIRAGSTEPYNKAKPVDPALDAYAMALALLQTEIRFAERITADRVEWIREQQAERWRDVETMLNL
jgi:hypothetical protein